MFKQVDPTLLKLVDEPDPELVDRQIRDEQEEILRDLHRELESVDRRVTRSRARSLNIPLCQAAAPAPDPDSVRRESIRRGKLPVRSQQRRANEAVQLIHTQIPEAHDEDALDLVVDEPDFDEEGNGINDGGMLSSEDSSSSSDDEF